MRKIRLSELFTKPERPVIIYHLMFGKKNKTPCPMCTAWMDVLNAAAPHIEQNADVFLVAAADPAALRAHARNRGWNNLRLLSAGDSTFKYDLKSEHPDGGQDSTVSVFTLGRDGVPRHFYSAHPWMSAEVRERGVDLLCPIWSYLDLTPNGRGDFYTKLSYPATPPR